MKKTAIAASLLWAVPMFAFAQDVSGLINKAGSLLNSLIPLLIALTLVVFFWGLFQYVRAAGGEGGNNGRSIMIAGIVALFIMVSVWGIIRLLQNTILGGNSSGSIPVPGIDCKGDGCSTR